MDPYELSKQYLIEDFPAKYRNVLIGEIPKEEEFDLQCLHEVFSSGLHKGEKMVEFGCGPTVHKIASASKYYNDIITSDYAPDNIKAVEKWLKGDPECLDWSPFFEIVAKLEGYSDISEGVKGIEERIRRKVKSVIHCDILRDHPLPPSIKDVDLLFTSGCLESACLTLESYVSAVKKLGTYVRPGGSMIMSVVLGMSAVPFEGQIIKVLSVDLETVERAFKEAGFKKDRLYYKVNEEKKFECQGGILIIGIKE